MKRKLPAHSPSRRLRAWILGWLDSNEWPFMPPRWWRGTARERETWFLRREARRRLRAQLVARQGWARTITQALVWPALAAVKTTGYVRACRRALYPGRSFAGVWREAYWLLLAHNIRLSDQSDNCLNWPKKRAQARLCLVCREQQVLLGAAHTRQRGYPRIDDKQAFAHFCAEHGLPAAGIVAEAGAAPGAPWPPRDLIFKPANLGKGRGIERLRYAGAGWRDAQGNEVGPDTVAAWAERRGLGGSWVVQVFLRNAESWRPFTTGALSTCRVITARLQREREPQLLGAFARFSRDSNTVDNLSAGGIGAGIDLATARMTSGEVWAGNLQSYKTHPETGARIEGAVLPDWEKLAALALAAHRAAGAWSSVGWDVASTEEGVVLIEANLQWAVLFHEPMGATLLPEVLKGVFGEKYEALRRAAA